MANKKVAEPGGPQASRAEYPVSATAVALYRLAAERRSGLIHVSRSERRASALVGGVSAIAPDLSVRGFPAWDSMPYDRAGPSPEIMGRRIAVLRILAEEATGAWIVVTTPEALLQRVPPRKLWSGACLKLKVGAPLEIEQLQAFLARTGYVLDERVDEAGEAAIRGSVVEFYPSSTSGPVRIEHADGRIDGIRRYDPLTQRTLEELDELLLPPASELVSPEPEPGAEPVERFAGIEQFLPEFYETTETLFDYAPEAAVMIEPGAEDRRDHFLEQVADAYETRQATRSETAAAQPARPALPPCRLYLEAAEWCARLKERDLLDLSSALSVEVQPAPRFAGEAKPARAFSAFVGEQLAAGHQVILAAGSDRDRATMVRRAAVKIGPAEARGWADIDAAPAGALLTLGADFDGGFVDPPGKLTLITAADFLGSRAGHTDSSSTWHDPGFATPELRVGDAVIHIDQGMAALKGIETVDAAGGPLADAIVLEFAAEAKLMVPADEIGKIWRYGGNPAGATLDRLGGPAWPKRRAELKQDIAATAARLTELATARMAATAAKIVPPRQAYERFAAGFPYSETPDQERAIQEVQEDLASGRPMDRLICGDVGFGKTEVALRAAAAVVLSGRQAAVVAPTTVLVRQHVGTFRRRFAGFGIEVAHLSRLVKAAEARSVKQGLASGETPLVIGTHALAGKGVRFKDLGLLIIDEEHRFGAKQKEKLRALAAGVHVLTLTATPIPRTLQTATIGLQDLSIIATPPTRRQPIRTVLTPWDPVTVRAALLRERRRGGQSFVVCPRVEDIEPMAGRLTELVPELAARVAHGKMAADEMDAAMVDFADGAGDILLATNIIESGLDVPRANTMLIWRPDRFGLAQLHQLRGRVGRGRVRGAAYLLTDPAARISASTEQRLRTLEAMDRLGAGFAVSARDLDLRGAGDLVGDEQAGHVKLIGMALYRHLLERALLATRGELLEEWEPELRLGLEAYIPADYIPEPDLRIGLYARLAHASEDDPDDLIEELQDRFGPAPEPVQNLVARARIRQICREKGVAKLDAGPAAVALTFRPGADTPAEIDRLIRKSSEPLEWSGERLLLKRATGTGEERRRLAVELLAALEPGG